MRAAIFNGPGSIEVGERPDPRIEHPTDAVVRVVMACVCGSDLCYFRGESEHAVGSIGRPGGRAGTPDEIGALGAFLMGPGGAFITGSDFLIDGGVTAAYFYGDLAPT